MARGRATHCQASSRQFADRRCLFAGSLALYVVARITGILEIEGVAMYATLVSALYLLVGGAMIRALWFPILYLAVALPPPDTVVADHPAAQDRHFGDRRVAAPQPRVSDRQLGRHDPDRQLPAACRRRLRGSQLDHQPVRDLPVLRLSAPPVGPPAFLIVGALIVPVAIFSNFIRVLVLVLITYYFGEAAAQGFLHDFAGLTLFVVALLAIFGADALFTRLTRTRSATA